jgi:hypothetical protein
MRAIVELVVERTIQRITDWRKIRAKRNAQVYEKHEIAGGDLSPLTRTHTRARGRVATSGHQG